MGVHHRTHHRRAHGNANLRHLPFHGLRDDPHRLPSGALQHTSCFLSNNYNDNSNAAAIVDVQDKLKKSYWQRRRRGELDDDVDDEEKLAHPEHRPRSEEGGSFSSPSTRDTGATSAP